MESIKTSKTIRNTYIVLIGIHVGERFESRIEDEIFYEFAIHFEEAERFELVSQSLVDLNHLVKYGQTGHFMFPVFARLEFVEKLLEQMRERSVAEIVA